MIGKAIMGSDVGGLLRYLYGPGDHNDHKDPHIVGAWRPDTEAIEPKVLAAAGVAGKGERPLLDFRDLTHRLKAPHELMTSPREKYVVHVPLSSAPEDPILSDEQWGDVAATPSGLLS